MCVNSRMCERDDCLCGQTVSVVVFVQHHHQQQQHSSGACTGCQQQLGGVLGDKCGVRAPAGCNDAATAEVALLLILMLMRRVDDARCVWPRWLAGWLLAG